MRSSVLRRFFHHTPIQTPTAWQRYKPFAPTYGLIATCCSVYGYSLYADDKVAKERNYTHRNFIDRNLVLSEQNYNAGRWWTMITHSFMHFHAIHLGCNMFALASLGPLSIGVFGLPSTAVMWLGSSVVGAGAHLVGNRYKAKQARAGTAPKEIEIFGQRLPRGQLSVPDPQVRVVGSSSSILGLFAAVACAMPKTPVQIFPLPFPFQIGPLAAGFGLISAIAYTQDLLPVFGHTGHLGGMAFGTLYYILALRRRIRLPRF